MILVLAVNIALHSFLVSSSRYCALFPGSHLFVPFSRYLVLVFSIFLSSISVFVVLSIFTFRYGRKQKIGPQQLTTSSENSYSL